MNHYQDLADASFSRGDYRAALQHYNKAIGRADSARLYDARAACHQELNDLPSALKDAKKCIQLSKTDPLGYIRAGKLLARMDKSAALEVMAYGLRTVKHAGKTFETLQRNHNELMGPSKSVDPMTVLPRELAIYILSELDFRQRINVCSVSRAWNGFVKSVPELWEHLDFSGARPRRKVRHSFLMMAVKTARKKIKRVTLNRLFDFDKAVDLLVRTCPIERMKLQEVPQLGDNFAAMLQPATQLKYLEFNKRQLSLTSLERTFRVLHKRLEVIECSEPLNASDLGGLNLGGLSYPRLRSLSTLVISIDSMSDASTLMPNLHSLRLMPTSDTLDLTALTQLQHLNLAYFGTELTLPRGLKSLKLACSSKLFSFNKQIGTLIFPPTLEDLDLCVGNGISFSNCHLLLFPVNGTLSSRLRRLSLDQVSFRKTESTLQEDFERFCSDPRLRELQHMGWPRALDWDDDFVSIMVRKLTSLTSIDLSGTRVTGVGVKAALTLGTAHLQELILTDCPDVSIDAIRWARSKAIRIEKRSLLERMQASRS